ncbi:MAG: hypothetical protein ACLR2Q_04135 [Finegoldia magna]
MKKFKKIGEMNSKQSELYDNVYEIFEFMGETLELPKNRFKNKKNGLFKMGLLAFIITAILEYYSSFDTIAFIRRNFLVGYIYFAIRCVFIFAFAILKFKIIYRVANKFFVKDDWREDENYSVLLLVMLQAAISMAFYPFGVYIVIVEAFLILLFFIGLTITNFEFKKLPYIIITFMSLYIGLRFVRLFIYNIAVNWIETTNIVFL